MMKPESQILQPFETLHQGSDEADSEPDDDVPGSYFSRSILRCFKPPRSYHYFLIPPSSSCFLLPKPDLSGHCRISTASSRSQWALPDLNGERQSSVGTAGRQLREPDLSGHCGTSIAIIASASARCHIWNVR